MSTSVVEPSVYAQLRSAAEARLRAGTATASNWSLGVDALQLLHRLSSNPQTAADALKLLHELQVHQVELDLQTEEMRLTEHRLVAELSHYRELYELAPFACFLVDFQGEIIDSNRACAELFSIPEDELKRGALARFLTAESYPELMSALQGTGEGTRTAKVILAHQTATPRPLRLMARTCPDTRCVLLACCESM